MSVFSRPIRVLTVLVGLSVLTHADDWPMYRHDSSRSGVTREGLAPPLVQRWTFQPMHAPVPSWPDPKRERPRVRFDDAFHVAIADGRVYFGSSADCTVYALDCQDGHIVWTVHTGGAVRFAPTLWRGRVYVASDDGFVYCLEARDGTVLWQRRAALADRHVTGHGRVIASQPPRTGVLIADGVAYFSCGIFPSNGVGLFAVDALTGEPVWQNTSFGSVYQRMAHGGTSGFTGVSPQGYLLASRECLFVPCGRSVPAAFRRRDGSAVFWRGWTHHEGGTWALLAGDVLYSDADRLLPPNATAQYYVDPKGLPPNDGTRLKHDSPRLIARDTAAGTDRFVAYPGDRIVVTAAISYIQNKGLITALDRQAYAALGAQENQLVGKLMKNFWANYCRSLDVRVLHDRKRKLAANERELSAEDKAALQKATDVLAPGRAERDTLESELLQVKADIAHIVKWCSRTDWSHEMILGGDVLYIGGDDGIGALDALTGETVFSAPVDGAVRGLALGNGCLVVSTDTGTLHCYAPDAGQTPRVLRQAARSVSPADEGGAALCRRAAETAVTQSGVKRGLCIVYGCGRGQLMLELLARTELYVVGYDSDRACIDAARKALWQAGQLGVRAAVLEADLNRLPCSDYLADLVVSETAAVEGTLPGSADEVARILSPCGGAAILGQPAEAGRVLTADEVSGWTGNNEGWRRLDCPGAWTALTRGELHGAADWTHQYAEPGNSGCSGDPLVKAPFELQWFGRPGMAKVVDRHQRAAAPLYCNGRLYHQGINCVFGLDAYNGLMLWERDIPGALRAGLSNTSGNMCATREALFVAVGKECLKLDGDSGQTLERYPVPNVRGKPRAWGWIAQEGGWLFGSCEPENRISDAVFALRIDSGALVWMRETGRVGTCTFAMAERRVFLLLSEPSADDLARLDTVNDRRLPDDPAPGVPLPGQPYYPARKTVQDVRTILCLDADSGKDIWRLPVDVTGMGKEPVLICSDGVVLLAANMDGTRLLAVSAATGEPLWSKQSAYFRRPVVVDGFAYTLPYAHEVRTGALKQRENPITGETAPWVWAKAYGCGAMAASQHAVFFRTGSLGFLDLSTDSGVGNFGGLKPSCWISQIAAGGLWLAPEGSAGCTCGYPIRSTVAMKPARGDTPYWTLYPPGIDVTPVKHLAINFGAPGDRRDEAGRMWFAWPRPATRLGLQLPLEVTVADGGGYLDRGASVSSVAGTDRPWLYSSGCRGAMSLKIRLADASGASERYRVRLHLAPPASAGEDTPVVSVRAQGKGAEATPSALPSRGQANTSIVLEYGDIVAGREMTLEITAEGGSAVVAGMEVLRQ